MYHEIDATDAREEPRPVNDVFVERWSPRALNAQPLSQEDLDTLLSAARWAPSSYNGQPWRFIYGIRGTEAFEQLNDTLVEFNQSWASDAGALILIVSKQTFEHNDKPNAYHAFDSGSAWMSLALQASMNSIVAHAMAGFDKQHAREAFEIPEDYAIQAMVAVGYPGDKHALGDLAEQEEPSSRKPLSEIAAEGRLP